MTIDKDVFATGMGLLCGSFSRTLDAAVSRAYYAVLNPALSNEEFERAVSLTLASETFWPSPAVLLGKVKADDTTRGVLAFEHVNRMVGMHGGVRFFPHDKFQAFDAPTRSAIAECGGLAAMADTPAERWAGLQKRFAKAYVEAINPQPRLAAASTDGRVKQLVSRAARQLAISGRDRAAGVELEP